MDAGDDTPRGSERFHFTVEDVEVEVEPEI
jgi:hypothetical protein